MIIGCTGKPGENAPVLNDMIAFPFVVVPSGNNITCGHLLSIARRLIWPAAWCLEAGSTRSTGMICKTGRKKKEKKTTSALNPDWKAKNGRVRDKKSLLGALAGTCR
jgi:hypothetical protein